jgi:hypothetical protein
MLECKLLLLLMFGAFDVGWIRGKSSRLKGVFLLLIYTVSTLFLKFITTKKNIRCS